MNTQSRKAGEGSLLHGAKFAVLLFVSFTIAACDGANQGVQIGTGQSPDPVIIDFPIAYIRAPLPVDDNGEFVQQDLREQITFDFGADLFYRDRASVSALPVNITGELLQDMGAVRDVEMAYDGSAVLFAMRYPFEPGVDVDDQVATWNIWQYTFATDTLERLIVSDLQSELGHDIMPKYLPDGRIIFSSTRQRRSQALLLDEGKQGFPAVDEDDNEFALNLHVMNADGTNIEQASYNQSHDLDASILTSGHVIFSRWDHAPGNDSVNLYRMNPDGSELELLYGKESHMTGQGPDPIQFMQPRETEDGRIMTLIRPFTDTEGGGDLIFIDTPNYLENTQPTAPNIGTLTGPAQEDATINDVSTAAGPSRGGRYSSVYPIQDGTGRLLVSWSQCRLLQVEADDDADPTTPAPVRITPCTDENLALVIIIDPANPPILVEGDIILAPPLYGIWIYDPRDNTQLPVVPGEEGFMFTEVVSADPRTTPAVILDSDDMFTADPSLVDDAVGVLNIRSVYDFDGNAAVNIMATADPLQTPAAARPARFLRVEKAVSIPDDDLHDFDDTAFGVNQGNGMREVVAYAMIEPDGSVITKVPANAALMLSVVDENGKRITQRHNNWISLRPGQELKCNGCHVGNSGVTHGRFEAFNSAYGGAPTPGLPFPNTDQQWPAGDAGDTMAEIRARITCGLGGAQKCNSIWPSMNVIYTDIWTADPVVRAANVDIDYNYQDLTTPSPTSTGCADDQQAGWAFNCRSVINYETIIHPLWSQPRPAFDGNGNPIFDPGTGLQVDNMCIGCHVFPYIDPADGVTIVPPAGQLELTDGPSIIEPDHFHAYRELVAGDNLQEVVNDALVDVLQVVGQDVDGNDILDVVPIASPARSAGALASGDFFNRFEDVNDMHYNTLSGAERRLIAEWLDVGAQYYNDPFDAPAN